ncbi:FecR family protein [Flavitalea flava]
MNPNFKNLIDRYLNNSLTSVELLQLKRMLQRKEHLDELEQMILADLKQDHKEEEDDRKIRSAIFEKLEVNMALNENETAGAPEGQFTGSSSVGNRLPVRSIQGRSWWFLAAASVFVLLTGGTYFYFQYRAPQKKELAAHPIPVKKIVPGSNKATLTLADGSEIQLDDSQKGDIAVQGGIKVIKLDNGSLAYNGKNTTGETMYNTVKTPRGGQYEIILPDGTHAWLNSASSLRFPATFSGRSREVTLIGQGYFEVAKNKDHPFIVHAGVTDVKVLGTSFDIMAYGDEPECNTTLVDGAITVDHKGVTHLLKPGEQAHLDLSSQSMGIRSADVDEVIAWKNGKFQFGKSSIKTIMRQIARWYDVEVDYKGDLSDLRLSGVLSRKGDVAELLDALEETGDVHFVTENNRILVMPASAKK